MLETENRRQNSGRIQLTSRNIPVQEDPNSNNGRTYSISTILSILGGGFAALGSAAWWIKKTLTSSSATTQAPQSVIGNILPPTTTQTLLPTKSSILSLGKLIKTKSSIPPAGVKSGLLKLESIRSSIEKILGQSKASTSLIRGKASAVKLSSQGAIKSFFSGAKSAVAKLTIGKTVESIAIGIKSAAIAGIKSAETAVIKSIGAAAGNGTPLFTSTGVVAGSGCTTGAILGAATGMAAVVVVGAATGAAISNYLSNKGYVDDHCCGNNTRILHNKEPEEILKEIKKEMIVYIDGVERLRKDKQGDSIKSDIGFQMEKTQKYENFIPFAEKLRGEVSNPNNFTSSNIENLSDLFGDLFFGYGNPPTPAMQSYLATFSDMNINRIEFNAKTEEDKLKFINLTMNRIDTYYDTLQSVINLMRGYPDNVSEENFNSFRDNLLRKVSSCIKSNLNSSSLILKSDDIKKIQDPNSKFEIVQEINPMLSNLEGITLERLRSASTDSNINYYLGGDFICNARLLYLLDAGIGLALKSENWEETNTNPLVSLKDTNINYAR